MRRTATRSLAFLLIALGIAIGGLAVAVFLVFGSEVQLQASGFTIKSSELKDCPSILIDVKTVELDPLFVDVLFGTREDYVSFATLPTSILNTVAIPTPATDETLMGYEFCLIELAKAPSVTLVRPGEKRMTVNAPFPSATVLEGTRILFPVAEMSGTSILTSLTDSSTEVDLVVSGLIVYPRSQEILWGSLAGAFGLILFGTVVLLMVRKRRNVKILPIDGTSVDES